MVRNVQKNVGNVGNDMILNNPIEQQIQEVKLMKNINLKGVTAEAVTGVLVLLVALVNAVLQMFGINTLPIENGEVSEIVSTVFLIATTLYNVYKNRNITVASQKAQQITDAIKAGEILVEDVDTLLSKCKK